MQEKGRKHGAARQNFLQKRGRAGKLAPVGRRGRLRPYINVASWKGGRRTEKLSVPATASDRGTVGGRGAGNLGAILLARSWPAVGVWSWRYLESRLRAGSFAPPGQERAEWRALSHAPGMLWQACPLCRGYARRGMLWFSFLSCFTRILQPRLWKSSICGGISHGLFVR